MTLNKSFGPTTDILADLDLLNDNFTDIEPFLEIAAFASLTKLNGWTDQSVGTYGVLRYYKDRNRVYVTGVLNGTVATNDICANVPVGNRPDARNLYPAITTAGALDGLIQMRIDGDIHIASRSIVIVNFSYRIA